LTSVASKSAIACALGVTLPVGSRAVGAWNFVEQSKLNFEIKGSPASLCCVGEYRALPYLADIVAKVLFASDDVGRALSRPPAVGSGFVVPLRFGLHIRNGG
jgi:hypothetical protein